MAMVNYHIYLIKNYYACQVYHGEKLTQHNHTHPQQALIYINDNMCMHQDIQVNCKRQHNPWLIPFRCQHKPKSRFKIIVQRAGFGFSNHKCWPISTKEPMHVHSKTMTLEKHIVACNLGMWGWVLSHYNGLTNIQLKPTHLSLKPIEIQHQKGI